MKGIFLVVAALMFFALGASAQPSQGHVVRARAHHAHRHHAAHHAARHHTHRHAA